MYHMTRAEYDAVHDAITHQLFRVNRNIKAVFGNDMTDEELRTTHRMMQQSVHQAIQAKEQQAMQPQLQTQRDLRRGLV